MPTVLDMTEKREMPQKGKEKPSYTTFRIFEKDGENLSELADRRDKTIAQLYHELFSETVRKLLLQEVNKRKAELEGPK